MEQRLSPHGLIKVCFSKSCKWEYVFFGAGGAVENDVATKLLP